MAENITCSFVSVKSTKKTRKICDTEDIGFLTHDIEHVNLSDDESSHHSVSYINVTPTAGSDLQFQITMHCNLKTRLDLTFVCLGQENQAGLHLGAQCAPRGARFLAKICWGRKPDKIWIFVLFGCGTE